MSNTEIWDALGKTDPKATKQFTRAGGFKGTAIKPQWAIKRITEHFGPVGSGWGHNKPEFQVVAGADGETLVYCTVECWHTTRENTFHGVGGDKVISKNSRGLFSDDEAFKKSFTDAVMNAFKSLGVGADIHMGQFDDNKYVQQMEREFSEPPPKANGTNWGGRYPTKTALKQAMHVHHAELERIGIEGAMDDLDGYLSSPEYQDFVKLAGEHAPFYLEGALPDIAPPEFIQTFTLEQKARDMIALRGGRGRD